MDFDDWADIYDLVHTGLPGEAEFYVGQAVRHGGPVLELGCGTGRIALPIAMSGVEVVGVDHSGPMLEVCRERGEELGAAVELVRQDIRELDLQRRFGLVLMPYRTFMHLHSPADQVATLARVREHLEPGGTFIFNSWDARPTHFRTFDGTLRLVARIPFDDGALLHYRAATVDEPSQRLDEEHVLHEVDTAGEVLATRCLRLSRTWSTMREVLHLASRCGFEVEAVFGDFDCDPPGTGTTEMIWVLRDGGSSRGC